MNCDVVIQQIPLLLYGELSFEEEELMQQHLDACVSCRSETERTKALHASIDSAELEPDPVLLADCRRNLRIATGACSRAAAHTAARVGVHRPPVTTAPPGTGSASR